MPVIFSEPTPVRFERGRVTIGKVPAGKGSTVTVKLPPGFKVPPVVLVQVETASRVQCAVTAWSVSSFTVRYDNFTSGAASGAAFSWVAIGS